MIHKNPIKIKIGNTKYKAKYFIGWDVYVKWLFFWLPISGCMYISDEEEVYSFITNHHNSKRK